MDLNDEEKRYETIKQERKASLDNDVLDKVQWGIDLNKDEKKRYNKLQEEQRNVSSTGRTLPPSQDVPENDKYDTGLYDRRQLFLHNNITIYGQHKEKFNQNAIYAMRLLKIMDDHGCLRVMYKKLTKWCKQCHEEQGPRPPISFPSRDNLHNYLADRYGLHGLEPTTIETTLPCHNIRVDVTTFDFQEMCMSLLTHPDLAIDDNWAFPNPKDPFVPPKKWEDVLTNQHECTLSDIQHAEWYSKTYYTSCTVSGRDVLLPVILFVDKTHTDVVGRLKQEPVLFTLGCFDLKTRSNPDAWRPLGYIPNMETLNLSDDSKSKLQDFHHMLGLVLKSLIDTQKAGGFKWCLKSGGKYHNVVFRCEVPFFCGDNEGLNKLCGRYGSNTNINTPCRICQVPFEEIGSTFCNEHDKITRTLYCC